MGFETSSENLFGDALSKEQREKLCKFLDIDPGSNDRRILNAFRDHWRGHTIEYVADTKQVLGEESDEELITLIKESFGGEDITAPEGTLGNDEEMMKLIRGAFKSIDKNKQEE